MIADIAKGLFETRSNGDKSWRAPSQAKAAALVLAFDNKASASSRAMCGPHQCIEISISRHGKTDLVRRLEALRSWLKSAGLKVLDRKTDRKLSHLLIVDTVISDGAMPEAVEGLVEPEALRLLTREDLARVAVMLQEGETWPEIAGDVGWDEKALRQSVGCSIGALLTMTQLVQL